MAATKDFTIEQGKTFQHILRWEAPPYVYKAVSGITQAAPAVVTTAEAHGVPDGWRVAIVSAKGMTSINAPSSPPKAAEFKRATVLSATSIELNEVNASDFKPHIAGSGYVQYLTPVDLTGFTARMKIKDKVGGVLLASTEAGDTPADIISVTIDNAAKTITLFISATDTAAIAWTKGVYDLEMVSGAGIVTALLTGKVSVSKEVTT